MRISPTVEQFAKCHYRLSYMDEQVLKPLWLCPHPSMMYGTSFCTLSQYWKKWTAAIEKKLFGVMFEKYSSHPLSLIMVGFSCTLFEFLMKWNDSNNRFLCSSNTVACGCQLTQVIIKRCCCFPIVYDYACLAWNNYSTVVNRWVWISSCIDSMKLSGYQVNQNTNSCRWKQNQAIHNEHQTLHDIWYTRQKYVIKESNNGYKCTFSEIIWIWTEIPT